MAASVGSAPVSPGTLPGQGDLDVLAVIDHLAMGGAEMLLGQFAAAAPRAGIRLQVACFEHSDGSPAAEPLRELGIEPVHFDLPGRPSAAQLRAMRAQIRALRPDVVHTHLGGADLVGGLAARTLGVPAVCTIHQIAQRASGARHAKNLVFELGRRFCDARVITVSDSARRAYLELHPGMEGRVVRIYNGVDVEALPGSGREVRRELGVGEDELLVGMVSALRTEKAHDVAIEAIGLLSERFPKLRLLIAGQGRLGEELASRAAPLGDRVLLVGRRTDVMAVYDALDVCLHPSRIDAFPTTLIEALAAGTPILASAVGGIPEIVQDGSSGVLIEPPPSAAKVAEALAELLEQPQRRAALAAEGRIVYERRFTAEPWVRRTRALYDEVLAESRTGLRPGREARS